MFANNNSVFLSATKPVTTHALGATSAMELAICCLVLKNNWIPPTINLKDPINKELNFVKDNGVNTNIDWAASLSYGFGGHLGGILLKK